MDDLPSLFAGLVSVALMRYSLVMDDDELLLVSNGAFVIVVVSKW